MSTLAASTAPAATGRARLPRRRRVAFRLALLAGTWLVIEIIALAALWLLHEGYGSTRRARQSAARDETVGPRIGESYEVLHPFVGFVRRPLTETRQEGDRIGVTEFGYVDTQLPLHKRADDKVIIAITGGSVAEEFATFAWPALERELRRSPALAQKSLVVVRLALSGYKQPQQLMTLAYLLTLGGEFDMVINLDGYNEVVLPAAENAPAHVTPSFPRVWQARVTETTDLPMLRQIGRIALAREQIRNWAGFFDTVPLTWLPTANLAWAVGNSAMQRSFNREFSQFNVQKEHDHDFAVTGPPQEFSSPGEYYAECARIWSRASRQLHQLCQANQIRYYHFLQPNQYVADSKPMMGEDERRATYIRGHRGREHVEQGYPQLIREGQALQAQGVPFFDLTGLFTQVAEPTYSDPCCHMNELGNELLARQIGAAIRDDLERAPSVPRSAAP